MAGDHYIGGKFSTVQCTWNSRKKIEVTSRAEDPYGFDTDPVHRKKYIQRAYKRLKIVNFFSFIQTCILRCL